MVFNVSVVMGHPPLPGTHEGEEVDITLDGPGEDVGPSAQAALGETRCVRDELEKRLPQIKNQINNVLSSKTIDQVRTNEDKERLRREILNRVNGMLITGRISNVYFEEFVYQ